MLASVEVPSAAPPAGLHASVVVAYPTDPNGRLFAVFSPKPEAERQQRPTARARIVLDARIVP